eukprot:gene32344-41619_t
MGGHFPALRESSAKPAATAVSMAQSEAAQSSTAPTYANVCLESTPVTPTSKSPHRAVGGVWASGNLKGLTSGKSSDSVPGSRVTVSPDKSQTSYLQPSPVAWGRVGIQSSRRSPGPRSSVGEGGGNMPGEAGGMAITRGASPSSAVPSVAVVSASATASATTSKRKGGNKGSALFSNA